MKPLKDIKYKPLKPFKLSNTIQSTYFTEDRFERLIKFTVRSFIFMIILILFVSLLNTNVEVDSYLDCSSGNIDLDLNANPYYVSYEPYSDNIKYMFQQDDLIQFKDNLERKLFIDNLDIKGIDNMNCQVKFNIKSPVYYLWIFN